MSGSTADCPSPAAATSEPVGRRFAFVRPACVGVLAAVFLMSGVTKVIDPQRFADQVLLHGELPYGVAIVATVLLPWLELVCGVCLALGYAVRESAALLSGLLVLLVIYALTHLHGGDCGCFLFPRVVGTGPWWWPTLRNGLLLLCSLRVAWR